MSTQGFLNWANIDSSNMCLLKACNLATLWGPLLIYSQYEMNEWKKNGK